MDYKEYRDYLREIVTDDAKANDESDKNAFVSYALSTLFEYEEIPEPMYLFLENTKASGQRIIRIDGMSFDETDHSLILFIGDYDNLEDDAYLSMKTIDDLYWRLFYFLDEACNDKLGGYLNQADDSFRAGRLIRDNMSAIADEANSVLKIKFFIISDKELETRLLDKSILDNETSKKGKKPSKTKKRIRKSEYRGKTLELELWTIDRLYELENAGISEAVEINFSEDFHFSGIPCLKGEIGSGLGYEAYIGIIPGKLLADIYIEYGSKILEGNVRAFLGTTSAKGVNNGIKRTINTAPSKFFTYNNGIAATAADVTIETIDDQLYITEVSDFQIINGGQTTATLAEAVLKKTNPDLDGIFVPMKLTVIHDRVSENEDGTLLYDQMVHDIARYANSQNRVTAADLFSNDPFHIWMEKASKKYLAPPVNYPIPTGWYYERSRKKYQQEQFKLRGDSLKRFLAKYPKKQIITKEQLAMYLTALDCKPHIVSKGKNWVMREFGGRITQEYRANKEGFNEFYYKKCVCAAIIYRSVDNYLESHKKEPGFWYKPGGYKLNIVPYTIAIIVNAIPSGFSLDWETIWKNQRLSDTFMAEIEKVTYSVNNALCNVQGVLVTEYCKKEAAWVHLRDSIKYEPARDFLRELISTSYEKEQKDSAKKDQKQTDDFTVALDVIKKGPSYWKKVVAIGHSHNELSAVDLTNLKQIIDLATTGKLPYSPSGRIPSRTMTMIKAVLAIEDKLESEGYLKGQDDDTDKLTITDYRMH